LVLVFGVLVSESFDEYGDTGFELIYFHKRDTFIFDFRVESVLVLEKVE